MVKIYDWRLDQLINELDVFIHPEKEGEYQAITGDLQFLTNEDIRILVLEGEAFIRLSGRIEVQRSTDGAVLFTASRINSLSNATKYVCNEPIIFWDPPEPPTPFHMEVSSDGQIAAMRYEDVGYSGAYGEYSSMRFYVMTTGRELYSLEEGVVDFELAPDGQTWIAGFQDGRLQVRQLHDGTVLDSVDDYDSPILDLTISPDGQQVGVVYIAENSPDRVVLDINLDAGDHSEPAMDGIEVLRQMRKESDACVLMLTTTSISYVKVAALTMGADDYLTKPFDPKELTARVQAILRRAKGPARSGNSLVFKELTIDPGARIVWKHGQEVKLTPIEFDLLHALARRRGQVIGRSQLISQAWDFKYAGDERLVMYTWAGFARSWKTTPRSPGSSTRYGARAIVSKASSNSNRPGKPGRTGVQEMAT